MVLFRLFGNNGSVALDTSFHLHLWEASAALPLGTPHLTVGRLHLRCTAHTTLHTHLTACTCTCTSVSLPPAHLGRPHSPPHLCPCHTHLSASHSSLSHATSTVLTNHSILRQRVFSTRPPPLCLRRGNDIFDTPPYRTRATSSPRHLSYARANMAVCIILPIAL